MPEVQITPVAPAVAPTPSPAPPQSSGNAPPNVPSAPTKGGTPPNPTTPPKRINAALAAMEKMAGVNQPEASKPSGTESSKSASASPPQTSNGATAAETTTTSETAPSTENTATAPNAEGQSTKGKESPWKLMEGYKKKAADLERRVQEMESGRVNEIDRKSYEEKLTTLEKRAAELQERLAFHDYTQHPDYQKNYVEPYNKAWELGRETVQRFRVTDANGNVRQASPQDFDMLMDLYAKDPGQAAELIDTMFGAQSKFITPRLSEVDEALWKMRQAANEFKTNGQKRLQEERENQTRFAKERNEQVAKLRAEADTALKAHAEHGKWLTPQPGDTGHNESLTKAQNFVQEALSVNINDPQLPPAKLAEAVQKQTAILNRAIAYGPLRRANTALQARVAELTKELEGFRNSQPKPGEGVPASAKPAVRGIQAALGRLEQLATQNR